MAQAQHAFNAAGQQLSDLVLSNYQSVVADAEALGNEIANAVSNAENAVVNEAEDIYNTVSSWF